MNGIRQDADEHGHPAKAVEGPCRARGQECRTDGGDADRASAESEWEVYDLLSDAVGEGSARADGL